MVQFLFRHTDSRKAELNETLDRHLNEGAMTPKEAESLRGRVIWFESFLFGRVAICRCMPLEKEPLATAPAQLLMENFDERWSFSGTELRMHGPPIEISAATGEVLLVFSDGAYEEASDHSGTVGGVLYSEVGVPLAFFSELVPQKLIDRYLEILATLFIQWSLWRLLYLFCFGLSFFLTGMSDDANRIIKLYVNEEVKVFWKPWFGRVPAHSNPADAPSRLHTSDLIARGVEHHEVPWDVCFFGSKI